MTRRHQHRPSDSAAEPRIISVDREAVLRQIRGLTIQLNALREMAGLAPVVSPGDGATLDTVSDPE